VTPRAIGCSFLSDQVLRVQLRDRFRENATTLCDCKRLSSRRCA
jgi:hypothetical protein